MARDTYLPVPWDFREMLEEAQKEGKSGQIHYFNPEPQLERAEGAIERLLREGGGEYLVTTAGEKVRLDKIVTLYGRPGPAFDAYESYGNACMSCLPDEDE